MMTKSEKVKRNLREGQLIEIVMRNFPRLIEHFRKSYEKYTYDKSKPFTLSWDSYQLIVKEQKEDGTVIAYNRVQGEYYPDETMLVRFEDVISVEDIEGEVEDLIKSGWIKVENGWKDPRSTSVYQFSVAYGCLEQRREMAKGNVIPGGPDAYPELQLGIGNDCCVKGPLVEDTEFKKINKITMMICPTCHEGWRTFISLPGLRRMWGLPPHVIARVLGEENLTAEEKEEYAGYKGTWVENLQLKPM